MNAEGLQLWGIVDAGFGLEGSANVPRQILHDPVGGTEFPDAAGLKGRQTP